MSSAFGGCLGWAAQRRLHRDNPRWPPAGRAGSGVRGPHRLDAAPHHYNSADKEQLFLELLDQGCAERARDLREVFATGGDDISGWRVPRGYWAEARIIDAIRTSASIYGSPPSVTDWRLPLCREPCS
jgi:hypothetical protein